MPRPAVPFSKSFTDGSFPAPRAYAGIRHGRSGNTCEITGVREPGAELLDPLLFSVIVRKTGMVVAETSVVKWLLRNQCNYTHY